MKQNPLSPCKMLWSDMSGTDVRRFCNSCQKHVHNLSEMTEKEAGRLLSSGTPSPCVTFIHNPQGRIIHKTPGWKRFWNILRLSGIGFFSILFGLLPSGCATSAGREKSAAVISPPASPSKDECMMLAGDLAVVMDILEAGKKPNVSTKPSRRESK